MKTPLKPKRYPNLGHLSINILESLTEKVIGERAIKEIRSPLEEKEMIQKFVKAFRRTETQFTLQIKDRDIRDAVLSLPLDSLPSFKDAIYQYSQTFDDKLLQDLFALEISENFDTISSDRIESASQEYIRILHKEINRISPIAREVNNSDNLLAIKINSEKIFQLLCEKHSEPQAKGLTKKGFERLPPIPEMVVGRELDIKKIKVKLFNPSTGDKDNPRTFVLHGLPGVGKTTLAWTLAHDFEVWDMFPDGILWTSLGEHPNISGLLNNWYRQLTNEDQPQNQDLEEMISLMIALLEDKKMLLLIDDVWKLEHALPFKVGGPKCSTLITTRINKIAHQLSSFPETAVILLSVLLPPEAFSLISRLAPTVAKYYNNELFSLSCNLEGLPLALQVAGRLLEEYARNGADVIKLINEISDGLRLLEEEAPSDRADLQNFTTPTVASLLKQSTDLLDEYSRQCFAYLSYLPCKPAIFDFEILKRIWKVADPTPTILKLVNHGLVEYLPTENAFQMHAVLVMYAKYLCS